MPEISVGTTPNGLLAGSPSVHDEFALPVNLVGLGFATTTGTASNGRGIDPVHGDFERVSFTASGTPGTATKRMELLGPTLVAVTVQASAATTLQLALTGNVGVKTLAVAAGQWTRLFWWASAVSPGSTSLGVTVTDALGATVKFTKWQVLTGAADTPELRAHWDAALDGGYNAHVGKYEPAGGVTARLPMKWLGKKVTAINTAIATGATPSRIKWLSFGDSIGHKITTAIGTTLTQAFGAVAGGAFSGSFGGLSLSATGTVTLKNDDFGLWPQGQTFQLASAGASVAWNISGAPFTCNKVTIVHLNTGGAFRIRVDGVDATTVTTTTGNTVGFTTITPPLGPHTISVVQTTGSPKVLTAVLEDTTVTGMIFCPVYQGGIPLDAATTPAWANWTAFLAWFQPDVITWEMKETAATLQFSLDTFLTATQAGWANADILLVQSTPTVTSDDEQVRQNAIVRDRAHKYGVLTWDSYTPFRDYATLAALGFAGDGVHVTDECDVFRGQLLLRDLGIREMARRQPGDTAAATAFVNNLLIGDERAPSGILQAANVDVAAVLRRSLGFRAVGSTSDFAYLDSRNAPNFPSWVPTYTQAGPGNAGLVGVSASRVDVRRWSSNNLNNFGDLAARTLIESVVTASISGTYQVPVADGGGTFRLTPTANGTIISAVNGSAVADAQVIRIAVFRGATPFTYSFSSNYAFPGGVAPAAGTSANRADYYTFQFHGNWKCLSSAIDVP